MAEGLREELETARRTATEERRQRSLLPTLKWVVVGLAALIIPLLIVATVFAEGKACDVTVVLLDLSTSSKQDAHANHRVVEGLVASMPAGGARLTVLAIGVRSFALRPLFVGQTPAKEGRFGEHL